MIDHLFKHILMQHTFPVLFRDTNGDATIIKHKLIGVSKIKYTDTTNENNKPHNTDNKLKRIRDFDSMNCYSKYELKQQLDEHMNLLHRRNALRIYND